ncbi:AMP-binding protein [Burkholderia sp. 22PA0106]|uniref:AMP-binding protein n=1 Tax=Burkholderia sp. 22PA0106 TaxID=3237371 RepID=UPI0039C2E3DC
MIALHQLLQGEADLATVVCRDGDAALTLAQFRARVAAIARALAAGEPGKAGDAGDASEPRDAGDAARRVAICTEDPYDFACALFAAMALGGEAVIPASAAPGYLDALKPAYDVLLDAAWLAALDDVTGAVPSMTIAADAAITLYTSGSSGTAKPVHKTLAQFDAEVRTLQGEWGAQIGGAVTLSSVPHHHIYGLLFRILWPLAAGRAFDRALSLEPANWRARTAACGATVVVSTPSQLARWPQLPGFAVPDAAGAPATQPLRFFSSGGPLSPDTAQAYAFAFDAAPLEIFGSTETGGIAWRRQDRSASWQPLTGIAVRRDDDGALSLRSAHLGHDDWYRTDDSIRLDADGRFALTGRLDRVVKLDGKRVSLPELEARIVAHRFVAQAAATRVDGASRERIGVVAVLSDAGQAALREQGRLAVAAALRHDLGAYFDPVALPRHWRFRLAMPFDARGKLPAAALAAAFAPAPEGYERLAEWRDAQGWHAELRVPPTLAHFAGHFPGCPILPGVVQIDWAVRIARGEIVAFDAVQAIDHLKFKAPVLPGAVLVLSLAHDAERGRVRFAFRRGERDCTSGTIVYAETP